ncbi:MAG: transglutaminase domain-containing protein [Armatimonadetes bacterium]|nr:transglutaminase domain-containing protein [Armatimonadota bacterium]
MAAAETIGDEGISLPLYGSGLVVTLCGVLTVTYTMDDSDFTAMTLLLTLVGFLFSLGCRVLRINVSIIVWLCLGLAVAALFGGLAQRLDLSALMPPEAGKPEERLAVLLCWMATLRSWALFNDGAVVFSPVPAISAIGVVASFDVNTPVVVYFCGCVVATTFLLMHYHALRQRALASPQERARPTPGLVTAQLGLTALFGMAVLGLGGVLIVPLEAVFKDLSLAGAIRHLAGLGPPPGQMMAAYRISDDATLTVGTGEGWSASPQVVLRVVPDDGQPHLWRGRTYDQYAGAGWISTLDGQAQRLPQPFALGDDGSRTYVLPESVRVERQPLTATFDVIGDTDEFFYAADPRRLTLGPDLGGGPRAGADGRIDLGSRPLLQTHYTVMSLIAPDPADPSVQARLRRAGADYPGDVRRLYLGNMTLEKGGLAPEAQAYYRQAVAQALQGLPPDRRTPVDEALAIRDWVSNRCTYSLAAAAIPEGDDHVYEFLAHTRRGYCDLFSSSMAVLCRVAGIPARVATGFAPGEQDGREFNLRVMDKHAWTEVYFPGEGWLAFDPTAGARTDGSVPVETARRRWDWQRFLRGLGAAPLILFGLILALLLYVAKTEWYDRRRIVPMPGRAPAAARSDVGRQYARMARILGGLGLPRDPAETPGEYAARAQRFLAAQGPGAPAPATVTALTAQFISARYGAGPPPPAAQAAETERALREFAASAARLRWAQVWGAITRRARPARTRHGT